MPKRKDLSLNGGRRTVTIYGKTYPAEVLKPDVLIKLVPALKQAPPLFDAIKSADERKVLDALGQLYDARMRRIRARYRMGAAADYCPRLTADMLPTVAAPSHLGHLARHLGHLDGLYPLEKQPRRHRTNPWGGIKSHYDLRKRLRAIRKLVATGKIVE
jgi:hypothetical protein